MSSDSVNPQRGSFPRRFKARATSPFWWGLLLLVGQLCVLLLTTAGNKVGYQHFVPSRAVQQWPLILLWGVCATLVLVGAARRKPWRAARVPRSAVFGVLAILLLSSAALSSDPKAYLGETGLLWSASLIGLLNVLLLVDSVPTVLAARVGAWAADWPRRPNLWVRWAAVGTLVTAAVLAVVVYQSHPHIPDEVGYLIQARYLAAGQLWMAPPPVPDAFSIDLFTMEPTRWYSAFPPGWPAVLATGALLGIPWIVNPLLAAVNVFLAHRTLRLVDEERTATLGALLLAASPWHLLMAMSLMSHTYSLTLALLAGYATVRARQGGSPGWGVAGGLAIGLASVNRPLEGVALALFLAAYAAGFPRGPWRISLAVSMGAGALLTGGIGLVYNRILTGHLLKFPVEDYFARTYGPGHYELGFGPSRGLGWEGLDPLPGHGPLDVIINTLLNLFQVNTELLGWATGSLVPVAIALLWRSSRVDRALLGAILVIVGVHSAFWFSGGPDLGARYWFLLIVPLVALAARGLVRLATANEGGPARLGRWSIAPLVLTFGALLVFVPWRAVDKYWHYRGMSPDGARAARAAIGGPALVLVRGARFPDYASAAVYNPVDVRDSSAVVFAWDRDTSTRNALMHAFPDRPVWTLSGPTVTGGTWRLEETKRPPPSPPGALR